MENNTLDISLDLGGDTLKVAFACTIDGELKFGKLSERSRLTNIAIPAIAYYNEKTSKWIFGNEVQRQNDSFLTIVKIKNLLSLLVEKDNIDLSFNKASYFHGNNFPKFFFPVRKKILDDFETMIEENSTFIALNYTPQSVCEAFFAYIKNLIEKRIEELSKQVETEFEDYRISIVHPSSVGDTYLEELSRIIQVIFNKKILRTISSNKALSMYAYHEKMVDPSENFLVFDMGEESISVVRACIKSKTVLIDGVDGHNEPSDFGGNDVDEAIVNYLERSIIDRETIGNTSVSDGAQVVEHSVFGKQYQLMKDIKKAKIIFSKKLDSGSIFNEGVPITVSRDVFIQRRMTKEQLSDAIGTKNNNHIAKKILDYIMEEVERPVNYDINKIVLSGGLAETFSLNEYIQEKLNEAGKNIKILKFDSPDSISGDFDVLSYEESVFAPSVGCSIIAHENIEIKMLVSLSYATWSINTGKKILTIFVDRGTPIQDDGSVFTEKFNVSGRGVEKGEEMFSTFVTRDMINARKNSYTWNYSSNGKLIIGEPNSKDRREAVNNLDLKVVSGGQNGRIFFTVGGSEVSVGTERIVFEEGISVDKNGKATPILKNASDHTAIYVEENSGRVQRVYKDKIKIVFEGVNGFVVSND